MHNLLPEKYKTSVGWDYVLRLSVVFLVGVSSVFAIGILLLLPAYGYISAREEIVPREEMSSFLEKIRTEETALLTTKDMLALIAGKSPNSLKSPSVLVAHARSVAGSVGGSIELLYVAYSSATGEVVIRGNARTRESLLSLGKALKNDSLLRDISVPVELLAKSKDISFELRGKIKKPEI